MRVGLLKATRLFLLGLLVRAGGVAQPIPRDVDYINPYTVSIADSPGPNRTAQGQPMSFSSLTKLTDQTQNGPPVEVLNLYSNAVGADDWHRLRQLRSLRLLAIFAPDTTALALDSLLVNLADLPRLEALRISIYRPEIPRRRPRRNTDTTSQKPIWSSPQAPLVPMAGFAALRVLRLSGDQISARQLISRFSGHPNLQRVELWGGWELPQKAMPDNLNRLPHLTELLINGRGWQGWETAFQGLSGLRSLYLSSVSAGGPWGRSHDEANPVIKSQEQRHIADLNRGLTQLTGLHQLDLASVTQVEQLRLVTLPVLTHLRLQNVIPSDTTFLGMVALKSLSFDECFMVSLPTAVCGLPRLTDLRLLNRSDTGNSGGFQTLIPGCLSRVESLTALSIVNNPIHRLPLQVGDLPQLRHLQLTNCQLDTFPVFISQLRSLEYLDVQRNFISFIPDTIQAWPQLDTLSLGGNRLTKLPDFLPQLKQLRVLAIGGNQLNRLPDRIGDLDSLRQFSIGDNALTALPPSVGRLRRLQSLTIGKNQLIELPDWLGQLAGLTEFSCDMPLTILPPSLQKMTQLKTFVLRNTRLRSVPTWVGAFGQLKHIRLESDEIHTLPEGVGHLSNLEMLSITGKKLSRLPDSFGQLSQLTNLSIKGGNRDAVASATGSLTRLPPSLVNCKKLYAITLTDQPQLDIVTLFEQLAQLVALRHVDLTGDRIHSLPPIEWASLRWRSLRLTENSLTTPPLELAQVRDLQMLDLRSNLLPESLNRSFHNHTMIREALLPAKENR